MKTKLKKDSDWNNIHLSKPNEGQIVTIKRSGENGFTSHVCYTDGFFETYEEKRNRLIITRWICDLWLPIGQHLHL